VVFNCAAFHNLDVCEQEVDRSFEVNARAVKRLGERSRDAGAKLVHLSTNYVFDGRGERPYREDDVPNPRSIYAISKLSGEYCALSYAPGALVVRGAGLYGLHGSASKGGNFVTRMLGRARQPDAQLKMVEDQRLSPTFTADLAAALIEAVEKDASGVHHLTAGGECSWFEFTRAIMEIAGLEVPIEPVTTTVPPGGVDRPLNGVLARPAADAAGLTPLRDWREALGDYMDRAGLAAARA
jgi:dTDP-4-dehydrorhamnose reductase